MAEAKVSDEAPKKPKQVFILSEDDLPEVKTWEPGNTYILEVRVKQTSKRQGEEFTMPDEKRNVEKFSGTFEMQSVKAVNDKGSNDKEENSEGSYRER